MKRHRRKVQNVMKRGPFGWTMVRPDGTAVYSVPKKETRISQRLMREVLEDADLRVTVSTWIHPGNVPRSILKKEAQDDKIFAAEQPVTDEVWSPFDQDGRIDDERLKKEGWLWTGAMMEAEKHE